MTKAELTNTILEKTGIHKREEQTGDITETPNVMRKEHEIAECIKWGWVYHHTGIPTTEKKEGEVYIPHLKFYVSGFPTSPFGIEWMRFEEDCQMHPLVQKVPHIAFEVQDIEKEIRERKLTVLTPVNSPADGILVAMIEHNGAPIELIQFERGK